MTKGIPNPRHQNLLIATTEARRVLLLTKNWDKTMTHMDQWLRLRFALTTRSVNDYIRIIYPRLMIEPELQKILVGEPQKRQGAPPAEFISAADMTDNEATTGKV